MNVLSKTATLRITKIAEHVGAEVRGIDLRRPVDDATRRQLHDALVENIALVIKEQDFTPQQFLAAAALFGEPMAQDDPQFALPDVPLVKTLSNRHRNKSGAPQKGDPSWHTDHTNHEIPPKFTTMYPVELPSSGGGTSVANMRAGFASLPEAVQRRIVGMKTANVRLGSAVKLPFVTAAAEAQKKLNPTPVIQPLVRTHPENGSKALYFHRNKVENILGMDPEESQNLLGELLDMVLRPEFIYTHQWSMGDMLIWDNRSALHRAGNDFDPNQHRMFYRAILRGDRPY